MKIIDDTNKKLYWFNRNYFFATTILVVIVNIMLHGLCGANWSTLVRTLRLGIFVKSFLNSFAHANWQHVLLNMLSFFIAGIYLERKKGTLPLLGLVFVMAVFTSQAVTAHSMSLYWHGYSGVNYGFYFYIIVDFIFMFLRKSHNKFDIISGIAILCLIYFAMCWCGGTTRFAWKWYPYDLFYNSGHYSGAIIGALLGLTINVTKLLACKEKFVGSESGTQVVDN